MTLKNTLLILFFIPVALFAQRNTPHLAVSPNKLAPMEAVETYDLRKRTEVKRVFFLDNWTAGKFVFSNGQPTQRTFSLKYDILNQELNVDLAGSIYVVPIDSIHGFALENILSINDDFNFLIRRTQEDNVVASEIFEVIVAGEYRLLAKHTAEKLEANYNTALDTGSRDDRVVKKTIFYLLDKNGNLAEIPKKKKSAQILFEDIPNAQQYLAKNKVNFKEQESLKRLFLYINHN